VGELAELTRDLPAGPVQRGSDTHSNFGLFGRLRMIPIVPIILAIVAIHLVVAVVSGLWILIPLLFLARLAIFRCGRIPRLERSPRSRAVAARRTGRRGLVAVTGTLAAGPEPPTRRAPRPVATAPPSAGSLA
jgi:hypothetical protein